MREMRYVTFHRECPEAIRIEIADRVARSLNPDGDPAGDQILWQMLLQLDANNMEKPQVSRTFFGITQP